MPSDYKQIKEDNIRRRGEEFDDIGRLISEQLYSDRTHFIYELLQNVEDALERRFRQDSMCPLLRSVKFKLFKDHLEFRHFGQLFDTGDVRSICDVLKGTKTGDRTQIGKFGIGFKSVYAFTSLPEIHSGDEHFIIERYIRPRSADNIPDMEESETVFIFPFNHENVSQEEAFRLIAEKLRTIGSRVLLFLKQTTEIEWWIEGQDEGQDEGLYIRENKQEDAAIRVTVIGENADKKEDEEWLIFERQFSVSDSNDEVVKVAFRVESDSKTSRDTIVRVEISPLVVFFPTEKYTRLGFLIQGPYRTIPSRDNILQNDEWNCALINETAELVSECLPQLRNMKLLNVSLLEALPIQISDFPEESMFRPIYDKVRETLLSQSLLPTASDGYVSGANAKLARGQALVKLLNPSQLSELLGAESEKLNWLTTEITETRQALHRYLVGYKPNFWEKIEPLNPNIEIRPDTFIEALTSEFLHKQSDRWITEFYRFIKNQRDLWPRIKHIPIIRLQGGEHVEPFGYNNKPAVYLPTNNNETDFSVVKREIVQDKEVWDFLKDLGISTPDVVAEVMEKILPKYDSSNSYELIFDEHLTDMKKILLAYSTDSQEKKQQLSEKLKNIPFVYAENPVLQQKAYKRPRELYQKDSELLIYFEGDKNIWFVISEYSDPILSFLKDLGVSDSVRLISDNSLDWQGHVVIANCHGHHERGLNNFDPNISVDGLEYALQHLTERKSQYIWNNIAIKKPLCIRGIIETSTRQTYEINRKEEHVSVFGQLLINKEWLPNLNGNFHKPIEIGLDDLPESFCRDEKLADQLRMKKDVLEKLAKEAGISKDILNVLQEIKQRPDTLEKIKSILQEESNRPEFPQRTSANPERRKERLIEDLQASVEKNYEHKDRIVRTSQGSIDPGLWLRNQYTNKLEQMVCQICKKEMPFKKRNGEYYFEHVEIFDQNILSKEHETQYLALCPLCAAMYKEFVKRDEEMMECFKENLINSEVLEIPIQLGDRKSTVHFVETHFHDLRVILRENKNFNNI